MHATLAALSQAIPTLTFAHNHKTLDINGAVLGQRDFLIDTRKVDIAYLLEIKICTKIRHISAVGITTLLLISINPVFSADESCIYCGMDKSNDENEKMTK